jgi:hypothetical protein
LFFPNTGRQINSLAGRMLADTLQDIDEIGIRVDTLQLTRHQQALDDADLLAALFGHIQTVKRRPIPLVWTQTCRSRLQPQTDN